VVSSVPSKREGKAFSLFSVVTFANDECVSSSGLSGICQTSTECSDNKGTATGNCASGFGVCCVYTDTTCGTDTAIKHNCTYIQNPGYSSTYATSGKTCSFKISGSADICQIRLDFVVGTFDPTTTSSGACGTDKVSVTSPSSTKLMQFEHLCGDLKGDHIYIETARATAGASLSIVTGSTTAKTWSIKVRKIECDSPMRAPTDCLQYYTGAAGQVESFNGVIGMINNLNYQACIRKEAGMCSIEYKQALISTTTASSFSLGATVTIAEIGAKCTTNYITIEGIPGATTVDGGRLCGGFLSDTQGDKTAGVITSTASQFGLGVQSNTVVANGKGFKVIYTQKPC